MLGSGGAITHTHTPKMACRGPFHMAAQGAPSAVWTLLAFQPARMLQGVGRLLVAVFLAGVATYLFTCHTAAVAVQKGHCAWEQCKITERAQAGIPTP